MDGKTNSKCRTCFQNDKKMLPLIKNARGCSPKRTYIQLLKEFAKIEFVLDRERYLPQQICLICCRQLRNMYAFISQAQHWNKKLLVLANKQKQLDCLQERTIDLPSIELYKSINIKVESEGDAFCSTENAETGDTMTDSINIKNEENAANNLFLKAEFLDGPPDKVTTQAVANIAGMYVDDVDNAVVDEMVDNIKKMFADDDVEEENENKISTQDQTNNLLVKSATKSDNNISTTNLNYSTELSVASDQKVLCPICKKLVSRRDNLIKHMRIQHGIRDAGRLLEKQQTGHNDQMFSCKLCPSKYTNKYKYLNHLMDKHGINKRKNNQREGVQMVNKIIKCRSCDYTAKTYAALHYHNRSKHGTDDDKFKCKFCPYLCLKKFDLLIHIKNVHKELIKNLRIERENKGMEEEIPSISMTLQDVLKKSNFKNKIEHCEINTQDNYMGSTKETAKQNENTGDNDEAIDSSDDNTVLAQKTIKPKEFGINLDFEMDQESSDDEFIRNILNIKKRQPKSLPTKYLARRCDECGNIYKNQQALYAHQRHVHITEDKYSLCPHCGKKYKRKNDLKNHIEKAHTQKTETEVSKPPAKVREKRFMCTECSYICSTITILKIHMNRHHTGEKPYQCDICYKSFIVPFDLKTHRYLHTGERPYKCPICLKGFRDNSHMIKHKRIHSGERPYKCKECGKGFTQSYNLSVHKRTHLKEQQLNCPICGKLFENKSLLNIHRIHENHHDEIL